MHRGQECLLVKNQIRALTTLTMLHNRVFREFAGFEMSLAEGGVSEFILSPEIPSSSSFKRDGDDDDNLYLATFADRAEKGLGMMTNKPMRKSTIAMTNLAAASIVIGHRKHDVCNNCYQRIPKAAKAHLQCKHFQYCCRECLDDSRDFMSCCGDAINAIMTRSLPKSSDSFEMRQESARETQLLAMMLLYNIATSETIEEVTYRLQVRQTPPTFVSLYLTSYPTIFCRYFDYLIRCQDQTWVSMIYIILQSSFSIFSIHACHSYDVDLIPYLFSIVLACCNCFASYDSMRSRCRVQE